MKAVEITMILWSNVWQKSLPVSACDTEHVQFSVPGDCYCFVVNI